MALVMQGFSDSNKVPDFYGETLFGQSQIKLGSIALRCMVCGLKATGGGSLANDIASVRILSKEDADTYLGAGGRAARQCYAALDECQGLDGFELYACAPAPAGGAVAATLTITASGTASDAGTVDVWIGGEHVEVNVANSDSAATAAGKMDTAIKAAVNYARFPASSGVSSVVVTLTDRSTGIGGNLITCFVDYTRAPGLSFALAGGTAYTTGSTTLKGAPFSGGVGTETLTTIHSTLFPQQNTFVAPAQNDATSLGLWEAQCDLKAAPIEGRMEHYVTASSGSFAAATSLAQTTLNNARFTLKWLEASETHPAEIAAAVACLRAALEGTTPNKGYDDYAYRTIKPQRVQSYWVGTFAAKQAALDVGVSPLITGTDGKVRECRSITTRCLNGSTPDYRTLDTSDSYVPDYARRRIGTVYTSSVRPSMPYVSPDPVAGEPEPEPEVLTPNRWTPRVNAELAQMAKENILCQVTLNPATSEYNYVANRIMTAMPVVPLPKNHQVGVSVRQLNVSPP